MTHVEKLDAALLQSMEKNAAAGAFLKGGLGRLMKTGLAPLRGLGKTKFITKAPKFQNTLRQSAAGGLKKSRGLLNSARKVDPQMARWGEILGSVPGNALRLSWSIPGVIVGNELINHRQRMENQRLKSTLADLARGSFKDRMGYALNPRHKILRTLNPEPWEDPKYGAPK